MSFAIRKGWQSDSSGRILAADARDAGNMRIQVFAPIVLSEQPFLRGDCNDDAEVDISDAVCVCEWLFLERPAPGCVAAMNVNGDDAVDISDPTGLIRYLFCEGPAPAEPFPECGPGTLADDSSGARRHRLLARSRAGFELPLSNVYGRLVPSHTPALATRPTTGGLRGPGGGGSSNSLVYWSDRKPLNGLEAFSGLGDDGTSSEFGAGDGSPTP